MKIFLVAIGFVSILALQDACAHGLTLEVLADGSTLRGTARYTDRSPVERESVLIYASSDAKAPLATLATGADGRFIFQAQPGREYRVVIDAGEGHSVEQLVATSAAANVEPVAAGLTRAQLDAALVPIREDIAQLESRWRLSDLIAGIGYLLGAFGLVAWLRTRKP